MKRYKNISSYTLAIDCLSHTYYMRPGENAILPITRDVRHYSRLNKLILVKEKKEVKQTIEKPKTLPKEEKMASFSKKEKQDKSIKKIEKLIQETENE